jgi:DNA (cytosine-5)-methyltransferase 1
MLIGAKNAGFSVVGNIEWRDYYRLVDQDGRNTFRDNFPGAFMARGFDDMEPIAAYDLVGRIDLAMGHPECGRWSRLGSPHKQSQERKHDPSDIPLFLEYVARVKPRYFVMDDLPQSFIAFPIHKYQEYLPEYDLFPEWVSNYCYGNPQKHRNRMFMLGALKSEGWAFVPGERKLEVTVRDRIGDLEERYGSVPNHEAHTLRGGNSRFTNMRWRGDHPTWPEIQAHFKKHQKPGQKFDYFSQDGGMKCRISLIRIRYDHPAPVLNGKIPQLHTNTCLPLSIRERARLQGFPDDFVFYGTKLDEWGEWENDRDVSMVRQTGKAMPIEFNTYVAKQIMAHIKGVRFKTSKQRLITPNPWVNQAKTWVCEKGGGYANQEAACAACWLYKSCDLPRKDRGTLPIEWEDLLK